MIKLILTNKITQQKIEVDHNCTIGREKSNDISIESRFVSKHHSKLTFRDGEWFITDLRSTNGTFVNKKRIQLSCRLKEGDEISIGKDETCYEVHFVEVVEKKETHVTIKKKTIISIIFPVAIFLLLLLFLILFLVFGFGNRKKKATVPVQTKLVLFEPFYMEMLDLPEVEQEKNLTLEELIVSKLVALGEKEEYIPPEAIKRISTYIKNYQVSTTYYQRIKNREKYIGIIDSVLREYHLNSEYSFIAFVESGYDPNAVNYQSGAKGMWQFLVPTAKEYGLVVNRQVDQRKDVRKSTVAAAKYISNMAAIFGYDSFLLITASFNCGDGRLRAALKEIRNVKENRSFFYLYDKKLIPPETRDYVFKVLAAIILTEYLERQMVFQAG